MDVRYGYTFLVTMTMRYIRDNICYLRPNNEIMRGLHEISNRIKHQAESESKNDVLLGIKNAEKILQIYHSGIIKVNMFLSDNDMVYQGKITTKKLLEAVRIINDKKIDYAYKDAMITSILCS